MVTYFWFNSQQLAWVIGAALVVNMVVGAIAGIMVPIILQKLKIDPAISGAVVLTTLTDVIGFISFLGLATLFII